MRICGSIVAMVVACVGCRQEFPPPPEVAGSGPTAVAGTEVAATEAAEAAPTTSIERPRGAFRVPPDDSPIALERPIKERRGRARPEANFAEPLVPRDQTRALVLMYHSIDKSTDIGTVWPWDFEAHLKRLRADHIEIIRLSQLVDFLYGDLPQLPARVAVITVDDGEVLFHKYAWPLLLKHKAPFALSIITRPTELAAHAKALNWAQLNEMLASGLCEIASHGHSHLGSTGLDADALDFELKHSRDLIHTHTGVLPQAFVYPLGSFDGRVIARVKHARYRAAFTAVGDAVHEGSPMFAIPRYRVQQNTAHNAFSRFFERQAATP